MLHWESNTQVTASGGTNNLYPRTSEVGLVAVASTDTLGRSQFFPLPLRVLDATDYIAQIEHAEGTMKCITDIDTSILPRKSSRDVDDIHAGPPEGEPDTTNNVSALPLNRTCLPDSALGCRVCLRSEHTKTISSDQKKLPRSHSLGILLCQFYTGISTLVGLTMFSWAFLITASRYRSVGGILVWDGRLE